MGMESKKIIKEKYSWEFKIKEFEDYYLNVVNRR
jgi:hypothetical protein